MARVVGLHRFPQLLAAVRPLVLPVRPSVGGGFDESGRDPFFANCRKASTAQAPTSVIWSQKPASVCETHLLATRPETFLVSFHQKHRFSKIFCGDLGMFSTQPHASPPVRQSASPSHQPFQSGPPVRPGTDCYMEPCRSLSRFVCGQR